MQFTDTGRYDEVLRHIHGHKYFINQSTPDEIPFQEAMLSWYDRVYEPLVRLIRSEDILAHFPGAGGGGPVHVDRGALGRAEEEVRAGLPAGPGGRGLPAALRPAGLEPAGARLAVAAPPDRGGNQPSSR